MVWRGMGGRALNKYMVNRSRKHEEKQYFSLVFKSIKINYSLSRDAFRSGMSNVPWVYIHGTNVRNLYFMKMRKVSRFILLKH